MVQNNIVNKQWCKPWRFFFYKHCVHPPLEHAESVTLYARERVLVCVRVRPMATAGRSRENRTPRCSRRRRRRRRHNTFIGAHYCANVRTLAVAVVVVMMVSPRCRRPGRNSFGFWQLLHRNCYLSAISPLLGTGRTVRAGEGARGVGNKNKKKLKLM